MPARPVGVTDTASADGVAEIDVIERASPELFTTLTADPGAGGTTLAVTNGSTNFPPAGQFKVRVRNEVMYVTAGQGTNSWTVTRGRDGTTAVAHPAATVVSLVTGVQRVEPVNASKQVTFKGRAGTFMTLGRAGTTGQTLFTMHNAATSTVIVDIEKIMVDVMQTAARVVQPPLIRLWRFTALPTGGTALTKVPEDTSLQSNSSVVMLQDAASDTALSGTALAFTRPAGTIISQSWGPRALTLVGYEQFDREIFFEGTDEVLTLRPLEGVGVFLDYTAATANPATDKWAVSARWVEYTAA